MSLYASLLPLLQAGAAPTAEKAASGGSSPWAIVIQLAPFVLLFAVFYFLVIRPQNKKQKEAKKMIEALKKGDRVVTIGGVKGVVSSVKEGSVIVKVDDNCKIEFLRSAISTVNPEDGSEKTEGDAATTLEQK